MDRMVVILLTIYLRKRTHTHCTHALTRQRIGKRGGLAVDLPPPHSIHIHKFTINIHTIQPALSLLIAFSSHFAACARFQFFSSD